jgi:hypothetical protein
MTKSEIMRDLSYNLLATYHNEWFQLLRGDSEKAAEYRQQAEGMITFCLSLIGQKYFNKVRMIAENESRKAAASEAARI